jgi:hypothetical protein
MIRGSLARPVVVFVAALFVCSFSVAPNATRQTVRPERFTALALPPMQSGPPTPVDILVERWSTPVENDRVMTALQELGTKGVLQALLKLPRVGSFGVPGAAGYPVRYAWKTTGPDGIERILLATDRYVSFWELSDQSRSLDYPITVIELRLKPSGDGDGQVAVAAKIGMDRATKTIIVENYDIEPMQLKAVKRLR